MKVLYTVFSLLLISISYAECECDVYSFAFARGWQGCTRGPGDPKEWCYVKDKDECSEVVESGWRWNRKYSSSNPCECGLDGMHTCKDVPPAGSLGTFCDYAIDGTKGNCVGCEVYKGSNHAAYCDQIEWPHTGGAQATEACVEVCESDRNRPECTSTDFCTGIGHDFCDFSESETLGECRPCPPEPYLCRDTWLEGGEVAYLSCEAVCDPVEEGSPDKEGSVGSPHPIKIVKRDTTENTQALDLLGYPMVQNATIVFAAIGALAVLYFLISKFSSLKSSYATIELETPQEI